MKLEDFLIGIGVFSLFTIIIFGFINPANSSGLYSENYLNITHDSNTTLAIINISGTGETAAKDYDVIKGDMGNITGGEEPNEANLVASALGVLLNLPKAFIPVASGLRAMSLYMHIPPDFGIWALSSIIIILSIMVIGSFLKNRLQT